MGLVKSAAFRKAKCRRAAFLKDRIFKRPNSISSENLSKSWKSKIENTLKDMVFRTEELVKKNWVT